MDIYVSRTICALFVCFGLTAFHSSSAQMMLNEANAVGEERFLQTDENAACVKPYEGFDYGIIAYSGNDNDVIGPNPGNPFQPDIDATGNVFDPDLGLCIDPTPETTLPNGWDRANASGFARIQGNGGDWVELVITQDHTDIRGWTLYWQNDENTQAGQSVIIGDDPEERGYVQFTNNKAFADLRAGTIITISEQSLAEEIRDRFPNDIAWDRLTEEEMNNPDNIPPHSTGHFYDLSTDESFEPFDGEDWTKHFHVDETLTDQGIATEYFEGFSDVKVDGDFWEMAIFDETNTTVVAETEDPSVTTNDNNTPAISDFTTGLIQGLRGELRNGVSVNGGETFMLRSAPGDLVNEEYEDVDFSSFGGPNIFNDASENTLDGVQDFSVVRNAVTDNTYDWTANGNASFATAGNWENARSNSVAGSGPQSAWSVRVSNPNGGSTTAQISGAQTVSFATVMSTDSSTVTLDVQSGGSLNVVGGDQPGRVLVMDGGSVNVDGTVTAAEVEAFVGASVSGAGTITGDLINTEGTVSPGNDLGTLTVDGDYFQTDGTLLIEIGGVAMFDSLSVSGTANIAGTIEVSLVNGYTPSSGASFVVLDAGTLVDAGYSLTGDAGMFTSSVMNDMLVLTAAGAADPDFNNDGSLDCLDVDPLVAEIAGAASDTGFDLTGDGMIDLADLDAWLTLAGSVNLASGNRYLDGDANLDGTVDGLDFIDWNDAKFTSTAAWCSGDFDANGVVDGLDFILWNDNKFTSADGVSSVPEPTTWIGGWAVAMLTLLKKRR